MTAISDLFSKNLKVILTLVVLGITLFVLDITLFNTQPFPADIKERVFDDEKLDEEKIQSVVTNFEFIYTGDSKAGKDQRFLASKRNLTTCKMLPAFPSLVKDYYHGAQKQDIASAQKSLFQIHQYLECVTSREFIDLYHSLHSTLTVEDQITRQKLKTIKETDDAFKVAFTLSDQITAPLAYMFFERGITINDKMLSWLDTRRPYFSQVLKNKDSLLMKLGFHYLINGQLVRIPTSDVPLLVKSFKPVNWGDGSCQGVDLVKVTINGEERLFCEKACKRLAEESINPRLSNVGRKMSTRRNQSAVFPTGATVSQVADECKQANGGSLVADLEATLDAQEERQCFQEFAKAQQGNQNTCITDSVIKAFDERKGLNILSGEGIRRTGIARDDPCTLQQEGPDETEEEVLECVDKPQVCSEDPDVIRKREAEEEARERAEELAKKFEEAKPTIFLVLCMLDPVCKQDLVKKAVKKAVSPVRWPPQQRCNPNEDNCSNDCGMQNQRLQEISHCFEPEMKEPDGSTPDPDPTVTMPDPNTPPSLSGAFAQLERCLQEVDAADRETKLNQSCGEVLQCLGDTLPVYGPEGCTCSEPASNRVTVRQTCEQIIDCAEGPCSCEMEDFPMGNLPNFGGPEPDGPNIR